MSISVSATGSFVISAFIAASFTVITRDNAKRPQGLRRIVAQGRQSAAIGVTGQGLNLRAEANEKENYIYDISLSNPPLKR